MLRFAIEYYLPWNSTNFLERDATLLQLGITAGDPLSATNSQQFLKTFSWLEEVPTPASDYPPFFYKILRSQPWCLGIGARRSIPIHLAEQMITVVRDKAIESQG